MFIGLSINKNTWEARTIYFLDSDLREHRVYVTMNYVEPGNVYSSVEEWKSIQNNFLYFFDISYDGEIPSSRNKVEELVMELIPELRL